MFQYEKGSIVLKNGKRFSVTQILRHVIQLGAFFLFPGLFLTVFHEIRDLVVSLIQGTFSFSAQAPGLVTLLILFVVTALWGRFFCGYLCSFGAMQELVAFASRKIIPRKKRIPEKMDRILKFLKYAVLFAIVLFVWVLQLPIDSSFSPWGVFGMLISGNGSVMLSAIPTVGFAILVAILIASFFVERFFCRYLCPLGALFTPASKGRLFRIRRKASACSGCAKCSRTCAMGVTVHENDHVTSGECIDCMRCMGVCAPEALTANPHPAIAGTASALVLCGALGVSRMIPVQSSTTEAVASADVAQEQGRYADGVYTGSGTGFRGDVTSKVTVQNGMITDITILSYRDDSDYFSRAQSGVIGAILSSQTPQVNAVSGATFSSYGIMESVADALQLVEIKDAVAEQSESAEQNRSQGMKQREGEGFTMQPNGDSQNGERQHGDRSASENGTGGRGGHKHRTKNGGNPGNADQNRNGGRDRDQSGEPEQGTLTIDPETLPQETTETTEQPITVADGTYTGKGSGLRGETEVSVTVESGRITDITILSYRDDERYFSRAADSMIEAILNNQSLRVNTVSGATFSSNGILEAVADALDLSFTNPNTSNNRQGRH